MEGGGEQHDQQVDGQENGDAEEQKDKEKEKLKIPEIGFIRKKDTKGMEDILLKEEYFAAAVGIY